MSTLIERRAGQLAEPAAEIWQLPGGHSIRLRPIAAADAAAEQAFFSGLSLDSRHKRFHVGLRELSPSLLKLLTDVDQHQHVAWVAEALEPGFPVTLEAVTGRPRGAGEAGTWQGVTTLRALAREEEQRGQRPEAPGQRGFSVGGSRVIADARYVHDTQRPEHAEFAIAVADDWQGRGLGRRLMAHLANHARRHGVQRLHGDVLADNRRMLALMRDQGARLTTHPDGAQLVRTLLDLGDGG